MTKAEDVVAAWKLVDQATNDLATRVQKLIDEINLTEGSGLDGPQTEAVLAHLASLKSTLDAMGSKPDNPIPKPPTPLPPVPGPMAERG